VRVLGDLTKQRSCQDLNPVRGSRGMVGTTRGLSARTPFARSDGAGFPHLVRSEGGDVIRLLEAGIAHRFQGRSAWLGSGYALLPKILSAKRFPEKLSPPRFTVRRFVLAALGGSYN